MRLALLAALAGLAAATAGSAGAFEAGPSEVAAIEALMAERVQQLLAAELRASSVECASVVVCAGAAAESRVLCDRPVWGGVACAGGSAVGGAGASPALLPGRLDWRATSVCGADCRDARGAAASCDWQGRFDAGCAAGEALSHPAVAKWNPFGTVCITYTVSAESSSTAHATLPVGAGIVPDTKSTLIRHGASASMCN